jgi:ACT domain-containing protein
MAGRSSISRNPAILKAVEELIADGATIDEVQAAVADYGISRSAVGRYAKRYRPLVEGVIRDNALRSALKRNMPDVDSTLIDVALHRAQAEVLRTLDAMGEDEEASSTKDVAAATRALRTLINAMREKKAYEDDVRESERRKAVEAADEAARTVGVTEEQLDVIRRRILGLPS